MTVELEQTAHLTLTNMAAHEPQYIVFIRVPFPRSDFVDPPFVRLPFDLSGIHT